VDKVAFMYDSSTVKLLFKELDEYLAHWDAATASGIPYTLFVSHYSNIRDEAFQFWVKKLKARDRGSGLYSKKMRDTQPCTGSSMKTTFNYSSSCRSSEIPMSTIFRVAM